MPPLTIKIQALKVSEMYVRLYGIAQYGIDYWYGPTWIEVKK